jgi:Ca-activated chloride channel family protein
MTDRRRASKIRTPLTIFTTILLACSVSASAQDKRPAHALTFPSGVELVNVNVSVMNGRDHFVTDLKPEEFVVLEDGVKQDVAVFRQEELPISLVLLLDMSASMTPNVKAVRTAAARLVAKLRPQDEAQVVQFNDHPTVLQDFTTDHEALLQAIQATSPKGSTALHNVLYITLKDMQRRRNTEELRRRAIVLLSDGEDTASMVTDDQVLEVARTAEINLYSILLGTPDDGLEDKLETARYLLTSLARESGAQAFFPTEAGQLPGVYDRIAQELQSQYSIGYVPSNASLDGNWRQILVLIQRDGLRLRHRLGYYAVGEAPQMKTRTSDVSVSPGGPTRGARMP